MNPPLSIKTIARCLGIMTIVMLFQHELIGATLSGHVRDNSGTPLPFATLYIQNTTRGTTTNIEGFYSIDLPPAEYSIVFQYVGYKTQIKKVNLTQQDILLDVSLEQEALTLEEVVVLSDKENPAYPIIRAAMAKRKYHKDEVNAYNCQVYIKGLQTLDEKPDKLFGFAIPIDTGIVYLSESISELSFQKPDKIKEVMISSKVSGSNSAFSYNQGSQMLVSFYDNLLRAEGLSERGFVSPIASNALLFYDYELIGTIQEDDLIINKIKVIPRRKNDPVFSGHIYIIEDSWRIHSVDLTLTKEHQVEFIDELNIHQVFAPVSNGIWMMISQKFTFSLNVFGFKGQGTFIGIHSNYVIEPSAPTIEDTVSETIDLNEALPQDSTIKALFPKKYFNNEILSIQKQANKRDDTYWDKIRPIPLTAIELKDYHEKDSLEAIFNSKAYKDSIDQITNKISFANVLFSGYVYQRSFEEKYFRFDPIIENLQFNTVEGLVLNLRSVYSKSDQDILKYQLSPEFRYGFSGKQLYFRMRAETYYNAHKFSRASVRFGRFVSQFNEQNPISPIINTAETLLNRRNYLKLYEKTYLGFGHQSEITNGILLTSGVEYAQRSPLENTSSFSFFRRDDREFSSNIPSNNQDLDTSFETHEALTLDFRVHIKFKQQYMTRPDRKFVMPSKYPRVAIFYKKGIPVLGSDVDFDEIIVQIRDDLDLALLGSGSYEFSAGTFLNSKKTFFQDFRDFNGNQTIFAQFRTSNFQLLDYYNFSTTEPWLMGHYTHHFNGFLINKLPFLRKSKAQVVASSHLLYTENSKTYLEYGLGLEHIFKILRVDYYAAFLDGSFSSNGIRLGMGF